MSAWFRSALGKVVLVNLGVAIGVLIGYRNGYRSIDLAVMGGVLFCIGNLGAVIGLVINKFSKPSPVTRGYAWVWIPIALLWLVYLLYALFPVKK